MDIRSQRQNVRSGKVKFLAGLSCWKTKVPPSKSVSFIFSSSSSFICPVTFSNLWRDHLFTPLTGVFYRLSGSVSVSFTAVSVGEERFQGARDDQVDQEQTGEEKWTKIYETWVLRGSRGRSRNCGAVSSSLPPLPSPLFPLLFPPFCPSFLLSLPSTSSRVPPFKSSYRRFVV